MREWVLHGAEGKLTQAHHHASSSTHFRSDRSVRDLVYLDATTLLFRHMLTVLCVALPLLNSVNPNSAVRARLF